MISDIYGENRGLYFKDVNMDGKKNPHKNNKNKQQNTFSILQHSRLMFYLKMSIDCIFYFIMLSFYFQASDVNTEPLLGICKS